MTKERRLAIKMWEHIYDRIESHDIDTLSNMKRQFLEHYPYVRWTNDCYFCQYAGHSKKGKYFTHCSEKCPLFSRKMYDLGFHPCKQYIRAWDDRHEQDVLLLAILHIIAALKGEWREVQET